MMDGRMMRILTGNLLDIMWKSPGEVWYWKIRCDML